MRFFRPIFLAAVFLYSQLLAAVSLDFFKNKMTQSLARELEKEYHIPISWIQKQFKHLEMDTQTIELIQKPLEDKPWGTYQKLILKPSRIENGKAFIEQEYKTLSHYEKIYRIPKEIVAAIIGIETNYGADKGTHTALSALATLAYYYPPRAQFFRQETKELLRLAYQSRWDLASVKSSYAGALGIPQFMPSAMSQYAKGHSKHPHNLFNNTNDAIASIYHYLHIRGHWKPHQKIIDHFRPNNDQLAYLRTHKLDHLSFIPAAKLSKEVFPRIGSLHQTQKDHTANASIAYGIRITTDGEKHNYFIVYENFQSILSYNKSGHYAHAVTELANRFKTITSKPSTHAKKP